MCSRWGDLSLTTAGLNFGPQGSELGGLPTLWRRTVGTWFLAICSFKTALSYIWVFFFLYLFNTLDISGEILFQKRDMGLKDQV